ncbi:MAG: hypothetical protein U1F42_08515 [Candidatus Competibacteraceae bacterium]
MNPSRCARALAFWLSPRLVKLLLLIAAILVGHAASAAQDPWPREIKAKEGKVVIYQPQLESFQGDKVAVRAAVSVQKADMKVPVFGVVWFDSRVATDRDKRIVEFQEIKVTKIKFPNAQPEQERRLAAFLDREIAGWPKPTMSLDRLLAALAEVEKVKTGANFNNTPPKIIFTTTPSVLVLIDGQPILRDVEGFPIKRVVNTPFVLLFDPADSKYYLTGDALWFVASDVKGPWQTLESPPAQVAATAKKIAEAEVPTKVQPATLKAEGVPQIVVATEPTELIVADGAPQFAPLEGADLLYLSNSGRDVFQTVGAQQYYVLLSGRWFASPSLENGPWSYVAPDKLPAGVYRIPPASVKGHVLAFVPDTPQAKEAVADAQIPVTAAISRKATAKISYDGVPKFQSIEGTSLQYAVNTTTPVIKAQDQYYAVDRAVWYQSTQPDGGYQVAASVPQEIYQIPPSSPVYNVTYVRVYQATPEVVYVGYTPGYTGTYVVGGTVAYGTGYVYPPYVAPAAYYPAPVTYGYAPIYDPGYGAWNFMAGATFGFIAGAAASNWWGGCCGWHGDTNIDINRNINISRDYVQHLNVNRANLQNANFNRQNFQSLGANRQDFRNNVYKNPNWSQQLQNNRRSQLNQRNERLASGQGARSDRTQDRQARAGERQGGQAAQRQQQRREGGAPARPEQRQAAREARSTQQRQATREARSTQQRPAARETRPAQQQRQTSREGARQQRPAGAGSARPEQRAKPADLGRNNVFADRDGNVYRRTNQSWEQRDRNNWSRPETRPQTNFANQQPALDRDFNSRARGTERAQNFQRSSGGWGGGFDRSGGGFSGSRGGGFGGRGGGFRGRR